MTELTLESVVVRGVDVPLNRPIIAHLGTFEKWPYLCIDLITKEGIVGKSYIGPYLKDYLPPIASCIRILSKKYENKKYYHILFSKTQ